MTIFRFLIFIIISLIFLSNNSLSQNTDTGGLEGYEIGVQANIDNLPRVKQNLVSPPFVPDHEQVATGGPKIFEIEFVIEEKEIEVAPDAFVQAMTFNGSVPVIVIFISVSPGSFSTVPSSANIVPVCITTG